MKKALSSIFLILICYFGYGQSNPYPLTQNLGSSVTKIQIPTYGGITGGLIPLTFADTSAANTALTYGKTYNGFLIYTTSPAAVWWRYATNNQWIQILPSGSSGGQRPWLIGGNSGLFTSPIDPQYVGTITNQGFGFLTNNTARATIPNSGIARTSDAKYKYLLIDTSGTEHYLAYGDGGSSSVDWSITGNSGTTAGTNFIGTTDNVGLMFKTNNIQSGYIDMIENNTSFGEQSMLANTTGSDNAAFGTGALVANETGNSNTAMGNEALSSNISGSGNTAVGATVLGTSTGSFNTSFGAWNLFRNTTGSSNISIGYYAGARNTTQSNQLFIGNTEKATYSLDTLQSIVYGVMNTSPSDQRFYINSQTFLPYTTAQANAADSMMVILPGTGKVGYRAIPTSSGGTVNTATLPLSISGANILIGANGEELGDSRTYTESPINSYTVTKPSSAVKSHWWDGVTALSHNDTLFVLGGWYNSPVSVTDSIFYSVDNGTTWTGYVGKLPFACHSMVIINSPDGYIYMLGGDYLSTTTQQKSVYRTTDLINWTLRTSDYGGGVRILGGGFADDFGNLFWVGGQSDDVGTGANQIYKSIDGGANWTLVTSGISVGGSSFLAQNISNSVVYYNGRAYVIGGGVYGGGSPTYTKKVYSAPLNNLSLWKSENDLPFSGGRQYPSVAVWDNKIWCIAGYNGSANTDSIGIMSADGTWRLYTNNGTAIGANHAAGLVVNNDALYFVLGNGTNNAYQIARGNSVDSFNIRNSLQIGQMALFSQVPNNLATLVGNNLIAGSNSATVKKFATGTNSTGILQDFTNGIRFNTGINTSVGSETSDTTGHAFKINQSGEVIASSTNSFDAGSYKFQVNGTSYLGGKVTTYNNSSFEIATLTNNNISYVLNGNATEAYIQPNTASRGVRLYNAAGSNIGITSGGNVTATVATTSGTGTSSGLSLVANSLTTGNGLNVASSSLTTGNLANFVSTSTVHNGAALVNIQSAGANSTASKTTNGLVINIANTGTTPINNAISITAGNITMSSGLLKLSAYTVATLPTGITGAMAYVTDALAPTYGATLVGGGAAVTIAFYDGTNWTAH